MLQEVESPSRPQHSAHLLEDALLALHGAQHQGADHHVHGAIGHLRHVLPRSHHEALELQVSVFRHALDQELVKVGVGVTASHAASGWVELEVGPGAAAYLQQGEFPGGAHEVLQVAEELPLLACHLLVVHHGAPQHEVGEPFFAYLVPQAQKVQQEHGKCQDADEQPEDRDGKRHHSEEKDRPVSPGLLYSRRWSSGHTPEPISCRGENWLGEKCS